MPTDTAPARRLLVDASVVVGLAILAVGLLVVMGKTSTSAGDPFDSPIFWWLWLLLPGVAFFSGFLRGAYSRPLLWTAAFFVPVMVAVGLLGTVFHDTDEGGASLWLAGEVFVAVLWAVTYCAAVVGQLVGRE
jgi:hypothetical protein